MRENGLSKYLSDAARPLSACCTQTASWPRGPVAAVLVCVYIGFHSQPVSLGVPYRPLYTPAEPVTPMTGSEVGGSLARLGGLPDPPGEGEERQDGLAAWGVQVGRVKPCCST